MNTTKEHTLIDEALNSYRNWLDVIPDEQFDLTPPMGGWSYAEVYSHLLRANLGCGIAIDRCIHKTCQTGKKGLSFIGVMILGFASFPPFRVKAPGNVENTFPATKITKEEAKNLIVKCRKQLDKLYPDMDKALPNYRMQHPRMGMLNAPEWLKFIRIHSLHHLKQLDRIKNSFLKN